eukprot:COSAG04_NODE_1865_length_5359_cov_3.964449_2_plen_46_part_00
MTRMVVVLTSEDGFLASSLYGSRLSSPATFSTNSSRSTFFASAFS